MITSSQMKYLVALVDNEFIVNNAAIDLHKEPKVVSITIGRLIDRMPDAFTYHNKPVVNRARVSGLTDKGVKLYKGSKLVCGILEV